MMARCTRMVIKERKWMVKWEWMIWMGKNKCNMREKEKVVVQAKPSPNQTSLQWMTHSPLLKPSDDIRI